MAIHPGAGVRVLFAAYLFTDASWEAAGNRGADIDPGLAHFAFDMGNIGFANAWVSMGSLPRSLAGRFSRQGSSGGGWAG